MSLKEMPPNRECKCGYVHAVGSTCPRVWQEAVKPAEPNHQCEVCGFQWKGEIGAFTVNCPKCKISGYHEIPVTPSPAKPTSGSPRTRALNGLARAEYDEGIYDLGALGRQAQSDVLPRHPGESFEAISPSLRSEAKPERPLEEIAAQLFHETYERLAPQFGYETRRESAKPWTEVPENNKRLMIATCAEVIRYLRKEGL